MAQVTQFGTFAETFVQINEMSGSYELPQKRSK